MTEEEFNNFFKENEKFKLCDLCQSKKHDKRIKKSIINTIYQAIEDMFYTTEIKALNDLEYGHNQGLEKVQDYLIQLKDNLI